MLTICSLDYCGETGETIKIVPLNWGRSTTQTNSINRATFRAPSSNTIEEQYQRVNLQLQKRGEVIKYPEGQLRQVVR